MGCRQSRHDFCGQGLLKQEGESISKSASISELIDEQLRVDYELTKMKFKILLLGTGQSGKSTVLRQMRVLHGPGFSRRELQCWKQVIYLNTLESIIKILDAMPLLDLQFEDTLRQLEYRTMMRYRRNLDAVTRDFCGSLGSCIAALWADKGVQECFSMAHLYHLEDSAKYFLDSVDRMSSHDYCPSIKDILHMQTSTNGIVESEFLVKGRVLCFLDVGGQRNQRRKWIHCLDNVNALLFIVSLSEYNMTLVEDDKTNRTKEAVTLYYSVCNSIWFLQTTLILFLNKKDLLAEKLARFPLNKYCSDYTGRPNDYNEAINYFKKKLQKRTRNTTTRELYIHETCATDTGLMHFTLDSCLQAIIQRRVASSGLLL